MCGSQCRCFQGQDFPAHLLAVGKSNLEHEDMHFEFLFPQFSSGALRQSTPASIL